LSRTFGYAVSCALLALLGVVASWPWLDGSGRTGVLTAAAVALPLQVGTFAALRWGWSRRQHFLAAWVGGTLTRLLAVAAVATFVYVSRLAPAPTLLALAGFFFGMLLIEPLFLLRMREARR
jgi:hypothetical protein